MHLSNLNYAFDQVPDRNMDDFHRIPGRQASNRQNEAAQTHTCINVWHIYKCLANGEKHLYLPAAWGEGVGRGDCLKKNLLTVIIVSLERARL